LHFSPCGWFCFEEPPGWQAEDNQKAIILYPIDGMGKIEVSSARNSKLIQAEEILETHESLIMQTSLPRKETSVQTLKQGLQYIRTLCADSQQVLLFIHVFWGQYCVYIQLEAPLNQELSLRLDALDYLVKSLQALTVD
jgi:hypothetical protein